MKRISESPLKRFNKSVNKHDLSPKKTAQKQHTVYNEEKLKVYIKFKPNNKTQNTQNEQEIQVKTTLKNKMYQFDYVFNGSQSHLDVFHIGCKQLIDNVFHDTIQKNHGNNGLIFVYGNTGTGKTYSMGLLNLMGNQSEGIVPNSLRYIFKTKKKKNYENWEISISFCEVYMDQVYDLLDFQSDSRLAIREDSKTKQPYLQNETTIAINNSEQAFQIINIGLQKRRVAQQKMNRKSSRGHGLITVNLCPPNGQKPGKICFIDLAGCQRLKDSESKGTTLSEALHINSSLSSLQTLLMNISDQNVRSYRSSKLTRILQPYIQYGKINLFVTSTNESVNAIQFAKRCKGIKFMQRQLRSSTPIRRSNISEKSQVKKSSRQLQQLIQFKRQAIQRQKKLVTCILNLTNIIQKISQQIQSTFRGQTLHNKFSFSEITGNIEIQNKINNKIKQYQIKQQKIIQYNLSKIQNNNLIKFNSQQISKLLDKPLEIINQICSHGHDLIHCIKAFGIYAQYKNVYKKQFFMSQLKSNLLENKCKKNDQNIYGLIKYMNIDDKRVVKKLRQIGINVGKDSKQNIQNIPQNRNKKNHLKSTDKVKLPIKDTTILEQPASFHLSEHQRSAIYIDEV